MTLTHLPRAIADSIDKDYPKTGVVEVISRDELPPEWMSDKYPIRTGEIPGTGIYIHIGVDTRKH